MATPKLYRIILINSEHVYFNQRYCLIRHKTRLTNCMNSPIFFMVMMIQGAVGDAASQLFEYNSYFLLECPDSSDFPCPVLTILSRHNFDLLQMCHEYCRGKVGDSMSQCQCCYRQYPVECLNPRKHASKEKRLCSDCIKAEYSSSGLEGETLSVESDVTQARFHSKNALLEGSPPKKCSHESKDSSFSEKLTLEELDFACKDKCSSLCNNSVVKRKFSSTLITCRRRSKQDTIGPNTKSNIKAGKSSSLATKGCTFASALSTCTFETPPAKSCSNDHSEDLKNGKDILLRDSFVRNEKEVYSQETDYKSEFPASAPKAEIGIQVDEQLKSLHKTANDTSCTVVQLSSGSLKSTSFHSYVTMDVQKSHPVNPSRKLSDVLTGDLEHKIVKSLSNEDLNTTELPAELSGNKCSQPSQDLFVAASACDIDCNLALDSGSDEPYFYKVSPRSKNLELLNGKIKENMSTHEARIIESSCTLAKPIDKSNYCVNYPQQFRDIASKNNYLQLFPENRSHDLLPSANTQQKAVAFVGSEERPEPAQIPCYYKIFTLSQFIPANGVDSCIQSHVVSVAQC
ncbi:unnamed protein product [Fraxinus pennsylvanica]|uniref:Uncharacterized protein n=1 Tax=Fraxinus pennsylvanica TaxID=56036 RepID=A0AAD2A1H6_9LAMI|nr:unnamed protein product [Fraxinus pennsylvanica]